MANNASQPGPDHILQRRCNAKSFSPGHVAEVGVYLPHTSNVRGFIEQGIKATLVEANPDVVKKIHAHFSGLDNVTVHTCAVYDTPGRITLYAREASTYVTELETPPEVINVGYKPADEDKFTVEAKRFDQIDDGSIDLLCVDTEGCEWYVIKHMKSRPTVISLETHGSRYVNPFIVEIRRWMKTNGYEVWYLDGTDTVFVKAGTIVISAKEKLMIRSDRIAYAIRRRLKQIQYRCKTILLRSEFLDRQYQRIRNRP